MLQHRNFGILMPVFSLPSEEQIGTLGQGAYDFIDYLARCGGKIWQILPLNPTGYGNSPYQSCCSQALNYYFIDLEKLAGMDLLTKEEAQGAPSCVNPRRVDYSSLFVDKVKLLHKAYSRFNLKDSGFLQFLGKGTYNDFALFMTLKEKFSYKPWTQWPEPYRSYDLTVTEKFVKDNADDYLFWQFTQYIFLLQWNALKSYAHGKGISIMGDIPLYVAYDSAEVWKYGSALFRMDEARRPECVAGVPPDIFSESGQLWGNPVYDWPKMKKDGYIWWNERISQSFALYDILRIDHFRGFDRYFAIPYGAQDAKNGVWTDGPKEDFFRDKLELNIVAEDLGVVDDGIIRLMKNVGYPGMKILETAFDGDSKNEHKPFSITENFVCYTGTHDNMTLKQYLDSITRSEYKVFVSDVKEQCCLFGIVPQTETTEDVCRTVIKLAFLSAAKMVVIPMWDLLAMGEEARINFPSTVSDKNWTMRFVKSDFTDETVTFTKNLAASTARTE